MEDKNLKETIKEATKNVDGMMQYANGLSDMIKNIAESSMDTETKAKVEKELKVTNLSDIFSDIGKTMDSIKDIRKKHNI